MPIRRAALSILAALFVLVPLVLLVPTASQADDFDRPGAYIGLNAVYAIDLFQDQIFSAFGVPPGTIDVSNSPGLNARVGLRGFSWIAIEAQYEWVQDMEVKLGAPFNLPIANVRQHVITGNLRLFLPIWRIQPYILGGIGAAYVGIDATSEAKAIASLLGQPIVGQSNWGFAGRLGAGFDIYITKHIALNIEGTGVLSTTSFSTSDLTAQPTSLDKIYYFSTSAGLVYRF
jgi:opacity protein-like surface antigen